MFKVGSEHDSWKYIYSGQADCELAIFGSSRTIFHFNPKIIEDSLKIKTWNFGMNSANIDLFALRISEYLDNCQKKPQYITLVLDWHNFDYEYHVNRQYQLFPYLLYNFKFYMYLKRFDGIKEQYYIVPLIRYIDYRDVYTSKSYITNQFMSNNSQYNYNGFYAINKHINIDEFREYKEKYLKNTTGYRPNKAKFYLYKKIVDKCKKGNIKLNIVIAPMYYEGQNIIDNYDTIMNTYKGWAQNDSLPFINFSNDRIYSINSDTAYFYNCMHLNAKGADKFTSEMYVPFMKRIISGN